MKKAIKISLFLILSFVLTITIVNITNYSEKIVKKKDVSGLIFKKPEFTGELPTYVNGIKCGNQSNSSPDFFSGFINFFSGMFNGFKDNKYCYVCPGDELLKNRYSINNNCTWYQKATNNQKVSVSINPELDKYSKSIIYKDEKAEVTINIKNHKDNYLRVYYSSYVGKPGEGKYVYDDILGCEKISSNDYTRVLSIGKKDVSIYDGKMKSFDINLWFKVFKTDNCRTGGFLDGTVINTFSGNVTIHWLDYPPPKAKTLSEEVRKLLNDSTKNGGYTHENAYSDTGTCRDKNGNSYACGINPFNYTYPKLNKLAEDETCKDYYAKFDENNYTTADEIACIALIQVGKYNSDCGDFVKHVAKVAGTSYPYATSSGGKSKDQCNLGDRITFWSDGNHKHSAIYIDKDTSVHPNMGLSDPTLIEHKFYYSNANKCCGVTRNQSPFSGYSGYTTRCYSPN